MNDNIPGWMKTIQQKNEMQIKAHETRYGKLGELQTPEEKSALAKANQELKSSRG